MKRILAVLIAAALGMTMLSGCNAIASLTQKQYSETYLDLFDTVTTIVGFAQSEKAFQQETQKLHDALLTYHRLFDIYHEYDGINNLKTVNDNAGVAPVTVDEEIIHLLMACKGYYELTEKNVNVAMGSVLTLWHKARNEGLADPENAQLPDTLALREAAKHMDFDCVQINEEASTVYISDSGCALDVGAVAKGWATQRVAELAPEGMLISVGGNIFATGPKKGDTPWIIGIQDPDSDDHLHTIRLKYGTVVTSGNYQRNYTVNGKEYHHIIDPNTQMPADYWQSVTVVCEDSGLADALSTALFLLPLEKGRELAAKCEVEVLWVGHSGQKHMTPGFQEILYS